PGETIIVEPGACSRSVEKQKSQALELELAGRSAEGHWLARPRLAGSALDLLACHGQVPLPPYIRKGRAGPDDDGRYQTVFARQSGAVAAPTAGLHFTPRLFERLQERGIDWTFVTLHVGPGTFQPLRTVDFAQQRLHREWG